MSYTKNKARIKNSSILYYFSLFTLTPNFSMLRILSSPSITNEKRSGDMEHPCFIPMLVFIIGLN